jgi:undecaprenyl-diphosphatase
MLFVLTGLVLFPNDLKLLKWVWVPEGWDGVEGFFGFWGDFLQFNVGWGIVLLIAGAVRKDRWLRRAAIAFVLAGLLSGATTRVVKMSAGRARPHRAEKHQLHWVTFTGPTTSSKYHSYFSGHTSAALASAVALVIVLPRVGWIAVLFAGAVGWSRLYGGHHFPSDVAHGAIWGVMWGCLVGGGMARVRGRARRRSGGVGRVSRVRLTAGRHGSGGEAGSKEGQGANPAARIGMRTSAKR